MSNNETKDASITYENLFKILRAEKSKEELQKLEPEFYNSLVNYVRDKEEYAKKNSCLNENNLALNKDIKQYENIKKLIRELFDRREGKIIKMALNKARTDTKLINTSLLLSQESDFYTELVKLFDANRTRVLGCLLKGKIPCSLNVSLSEFESDSDTKDNLEQNNEKNKNIDDAPKKKDCVGLDEAKDKVYIQTSDSEQTPKEKNTQILTIEFLSNVPKFVGRELEPYGPFEKGDVANLPLKIAGILIDKGRAKKST